MVRSTWSWPGQSAEFSLHCLPLVGVGRAGNRSMNARARARQFTATHCTRQRVLVRATLLHDDTSMGHIGGGRAGSGSTEFRADSALTRIYNPTHRGVLWNSAEFRAEPPGR
jgi:hypothetical protein